MQTPVKKVVVVGGGAAGWITAGLLASQYPPLSEGGLDITLIESSDLPIIGVGEGTWPTMRKTLHRIGLSENDFLTTCNASFKQASKFVGWLDGGRDDFYYHPFTVPQGYGSFDLSPYWAQRARSEDLPFAAAVGIQAAVCEAGLAPKRITDAQYDCALNYAYHLDAGQFAQLLKERCKGALGVRHVVDKVTGVNLTEDGYISSLSTERQGELEGDFFVDCSGFASLLLGKTLQVPFIDRSHVLFADRALAMQVPYQDESSVIASSTIATARQAGWIWDIGLTNRRGVGYVYASQYEDDRGAEQTLRDYVGSQGEGLEARKITFQSGHRARFWEKNCVAIGLSAGFLEPLEASALMLVETAAEMLCAQFPHSRELFPLLAKRYNETFLYRWDRIIDFLKLHYCLSRREEPFWRDNRNPAGMPDSLQELLTLWRYRAPSDYDFSHRREIFPPASYLYVLYGMQYQTDFGPDGGLAAGKPASERYFAANREALKRALKNLPANRELLDKVRQYGFQSV